jgi:hypothetical protein
MSNTLQAHRAPREGFLIVIDIGSNCDRLPTPPAYIAPVPPAAGARAAAARDRQF